MSEENYAGNIIISLANMPDFLRTPILKKRITEFYTLDEVEQKSIVYNALQAAPDIPFPNFGKLFGTWLKVMAELPQENQVQMFASYAAMAAKNPQYLARFHLDGMLEIFLSLPEQTRAAIASSALRAIDLVGDAEKRKIMLVIPDGIKKQLSNIPSSLDFRHRGCGYLCRQNLEFHLLRSVLPRIFFPVF